MVMFSVRNHEHYKNITSHILIIDTVYNRAEMNTNSHVPYQMNIHAELSLSCF